MANKLAKVLKNIEKRQERYWRKTDISCGIFKDEKEYIEYIKDKLSLDNRSKIFVFNVSDKKTHQKIGSVITSYEGQEIDFQIAGTWFQTKAKKIKDLMNIVYVIVITKLSKREIEA